MKLANCRVHFIGIGGIGMSALAELLHTMGGEVSGSDREENEQTLRLKKIGVQVFIGHNAKNVEGAQVIVFSSAISSQNVEYKRAYKDNIPIITRSEALSEVMRLKRGIAVAGSHGKTTTASLVSSIFLEAKRHPTIVIGGRLKSIDGNSLLGQGEWFITEADESDSSFLRLFPEISVVTSIDDDHVDFYGSMSSLFNAFYNFSLNTPFYGTSILHGDDEHIREIYKTYPKRAIYYGMSVKNDYYIKPCGEDVYEIFFEKKSIVKFKSPLPGNYNALNSLAAFIVGRLCDFSPSTCVQGIEKFKGLKRRFDYKGDFEGVDVFDDYGHHPKEIQSVLETLKTKYKGRRVFVVFQPHRYTRLKNCWDQFLDSFKKADQLYVLDVYPAGEEPLEGMNSERLVRNLHHKNAEYVKNFKEAEKKVKSNIKPGDVFLTLGAGDVWKVGKEVFR